MRKRLVGLLAGAVLVFAACGTAATPSPIGVGRGVDPRPSRHRHRRRLAPSAAAIDLTNTTYKPEDGHGRRLDHHRRLAGSQRSSTRTTSSQVTEANVASAVWATLVVFTNDYRTRRTSRPSIPTLDNGGVKVPGDGGDAMTVTWTLRAGLKWSDGQPLTCDDFKYA